MKIQTRNFLLAALLGASLLSGCAPLVVGGAVMTGVVAVDRRTAGTQLGRRHRAQSGHRHQQGAG